MHEIRCPNCGQSFTVDEAGFAAILSQVRTEEFDRELAERLHAMQETTEKENELRLKKVAAEKDGEIAALNLKMEQIQSDLRQRDAAQELAVREAVTEKETEIARLHEQLRSLQETGEVRTQTEVAKVTREKEERITDLQLQLTKLHAELENGKIKGELAIREAVLEVEKERDTQKAEYEARLRAQQESLEYYKDLKTRMSTKMVGETLEQHCENSFNMIRSAAFRNAEFGKDNSIVEGTKGDYIYREKDSDGNEVISIMFEMKNEMDTTSTKHKNEDFFAKLDKDRRNKHCEYAILVSMLESDNDLYNQGIVDVSYAFDKMYVIRPQFFIPMITILRNAALNSMEYKRQLAEQRSQEIDITNFEEKINDFKTAFSKNYDLASKQFNTAIDEIDKTIDHLNKVKDNLQKSLNNLRLANNKAQTNLTIKALTKGNETMTEMFRELEENGGA